MKDLVVNKSRLILNSQFKNPKAKVNMKKLTFQVSIAPYQLFINLYLMFYYIQNPNTVILK